MRWIPPVIVIAAVALAGFGVAGASADDARVTVAIIDAPDRDHPDLEDRILDGVDLSVDGHPPGWSNPTNHGTAVAGLIAEQAPEARILPIAIGDEAVGDDLAVAIDRAVQDGADVISFSVALAADNPAVRDAIVRASDAGVLLIAGTGNTGSDAEECEEFARDGMPTGHPLLPAAYPEVVAVGGLDGDQLWTCSVQGPHVDLLAPAVDLEVLGTGDDGRTRRASGTSYAAPIVAGAAAHLMHEYPGLSISQVGRLIRAHGEGTPMIGDRAEPRLFDVFLLNEAAAAVADGTWAARMGEFPGGCIGEPAGGATVSVDDGVGVVSVTVDPSGFDPQHVTRGPGTQGFDGWAWEGGSMRVRFDAHGPLGFAGDEDAFAATTQMWGEMSIWLGHSADPADYELHWDDYGWYLEGPVVDWAGAERPVMTHSEDRDRHLVGEEAHAWSAILAHDPMSPSCTEEDAFTYRPDDAPGFMPDWVVMRELTLARQQTGQLRINHLNACVVPPGTYALVVAPRPTNYRWWIGTDDVPPNITWWEEGSFAEVVVPDGIPVDGGCEDEPNAHPEAAGSNVDADQGSDTEAAVIPPLDGADRSGRGPLVAFGLLVALGVGGAGAAVVAHRASRSPNP